jgi:hypothetical protein
MATRKQQASSSKKALPQKQAARTKAETNPKFPYTTKPASLRRFLKDIPQKPKPPKFDMDMLRSWGFSDANDHSMLRVLKAVKLVNDKNEPTELYTQFMSLDHGAEVLGPEIRRVYAPLFQASHKPFSESNEKLQNLFNIHSGGGTRALDQQIQTFKALCENASFDSSFTAKNPSAKGVPAADTQGRNGAGDSDSGQKPTININLHIHLPENKSRRDYEDIIEDIGRYIFGRNTGERRD